MATMIPPTFDEGTSSAAERTLYYSLQEGLDADWTVIHSLAYLEDRRGLHRPGECDFLLLHPRYGMLIVEVKSGAPQYDGRHRHWVYDDGRLIKDPYEQAVRALHDFRDRLAQRRSSWSAHDLPHGYAVAFPDAVNVVGSLPPGFAVDMLMLNPSLKQIQRWAVNLLARFGAPLAAEVPGALDEALDILAPSFNLVPALKPVIDQAHREFHRLSGEQAEVRANLANQSRMLITGSAGTGKTMLLSAVAQDEAAAGKPVLVLCFNRHLAAELTRHLPACTVHTFHSLCLDILATTGRSVPDQSAPDYWDFLLPNAAFDALDDYPHRFPELMVDEGQDFKAEWWVLVEALLAPDGDWLIFCDESQNLFDRQGWLPFSAPRWTLTVNRRNTAPIAAYALAAANLPAPAQAFALPVGPEPVIHTVSGADAERKAVQQVLHELVHEQHVDPDDIVILDPHVLAHSSFAKRRHLGNLAVRDLEASPAPNTIRHATVKKFKGLEADCVLLVGVGAPSSYYSGERLRRFVYVGSSRARVVLHVFQWGSGSA